MALGGAIALFNLFNLFNLFKDFLAFLTFRIALVRESFDFPYLDLRIGLQLWLSEELPQPLCRGLETPVWGDCIQGSRDPCRGAAYRGLETSAEGLPTGVSRPPILSSSKENPMLPLPEQSRMSKTQGNL